MLGRRTSERTKSPQRTRRRLHRTGATLCSLAIAGALVVTGADAASASTTPTFTSAKTVQAYVGVHFSFSVTTSGSPTPALTTTGTVPSWATFKDNSNGTATLSGTPATGSAGSYSFTVSAKNSAGTATETLTIDVSAATAPAFTSGSSITVKAGIYTSFSITASGSPAPVISESGTLPPGMSFAAASNGSATISGTPAANSASTYTASLTASNGSATSAKQTLTITVAPTQAPAITSASSMEVSPGISSSFTISASGAPTPTITLSGNLPVGLSFSDLGNGRARIFGVPAPGTNGNYAVTITATNGSSSVARQSLTISDTAPTAPKITSSTTLTFARGFPSSFTVSTSGAPTPTLAGSGQLPPGVTFTNNGDGTATISGTPPASAALGSYTWNLTASNGYGIFHQALHISIGQPVVSRITSSPTAYFQGGVASSFTVSATGTPAPKLSVSGSLPPGLVFSGGAATATISGTPPAGLHGTYYLTVTASNGYGAPAVQRLSILVGQSVAPTITSAASATFPEGSNISFSVTASGTPAPTITISGNLPNGVRVVQGPNGSKTIAGTPARGVAGTYVLLVTASNSYGAAAHQTLRLTIRPGHAIGYWYVTFRSELLARGGASAIAPRSPQHPRAIVAMAATPDDHGYWLVARFGGIFPYGDANFYGSIARLHLRNNPTVAFAPTPDGHGYWLVTQRGNVFTFGDARFYGSAARFHIPSVVSFAPTPDGHGYWLVTSTGQVLHYGDAAYYGSPAGSPIPPVAAIASTPDGHGYWIVTKRGSVFTYGDAGNYGSPRFRIPPVSAFRPTHDGRGYWIVTTRGNIFNYGDAGFYGSSAHTRLAGAVRGFALFG